MTGFHWFSNKVVINSLTSGGHSPLKIRCHCRFSIFPNLVFNLFEKFEKIPENSINWQSFHENFQKWRFLLIFDYDFNKFARYLWLRPPTPYKCIFLICKKFLPTLREKFEKNLKWFGKNCQFSIKIINNVHIFIDYLRNCWTFLLRPRLHGDCLTSPTLVRLTPPPKNFCGC